MKRPAALDLILIAARCPGSQAVKLLQKEARRGRRGGRGRPPSTTLGLPVFFPFLLRSSLLASLRSARS